MECHHAYMCIRMYTNVMCCFQVDKAHEYILEAVKSGDPAVLQVNMTVSASLLSRGAAGHAVPVHGLTGQCHQSWRHQSGILHCFLCAMLEAGPEECGLSILEGAVTRQ